MRAEAGLDFLAWPEGRLVEALAAAAGATGGVVAPVGAAAAGWGVGGRRGDGAARLGGGSGRSGGGEGAAAIAAHETLDDFAEASGVEADPVEIGWGELERALPRLGPAVLQLAAGGGLLVVLRGGGRRVALLTPDGRRRRRSAARLGRAIRRPAERSLAASLEPLVGGLSIAPRRRRRALRGLVAAHLAPATGCFAYLLGAAGGGLGAPRSGGTGGRQGGGSGSRGRRQAGLGAARLGGLAMALLAALAGGQGLLLGGWYLLGRGLLAGRLDRGRLFAWALLLLTVPLARGVELAAAVALGQRAVQLLRRRLAAAVLSLAPEAVRGEGTGGLLGRLLAAESVERLLLAAVPGLLLAGAEVAGGGAAVAHGAAATAHVALLVAVLGLAGGLAWRYGGAQRRCAASRLALTGQLVEGLAGHRTRLAQRGAGPDPLDDPRLATFHASVREMDDVAALLRAALPRAWLFAGLALLAATPAAGGLAGRVGATAGLAASLGGLLLGQAGLGRLAAGLCDLAAARTAGRELGPLLGAEASRSGQPRDVRVPCGQAPWLVEARDLGYRPGGRARPVLAGAALTIRRGERLLLDGASGSGKSSLAGLLAGQLVADSGLLLLDGLDLATTGTRAWRRRAVAVPQLHANHLFADTLAFNLLLGRGWPPSARDLGRAARLCRDLGLGDLLDRLPAGLEQRIGEAGWQLSDGETSRVCLARALLQDPDLLILDESLAALDPETRLLALDVAAKRARTLLLIAHAALE